MNLRKSIATSLASFLVRNAEPVRITAAECDGRTEGWERDLNRRRPVSRLISEDEEYNYGHREEMMAEARALCQTHGICTSLLGKFANYCVGNCEVSFSTGDPKWDEMAENVVREQFKLIDASGRHDMVSMAKLAIKSVVRDGDIGFAKVLEPGLWPQLQAIEADRIRNDSTPFAPDSDKRWIGGVRALTNGRAVAYRVWDRMMTHGFENPREIPAEAFIHLKNPHRFDGTRGLTWFARGTLNHARDIKEILNAEKKAVKVNSRFALFWSKVSGNKSTGLTNLFGTRSDGAGNIYTEELQDGMIGYGVPGEQIQAHTYNRPSPTWQGFMEFIIRDIAVSLELPIGFVWAIMGVTGPGVRLESKQAEKTFFATIEWLERGLLNPVTGWIINWAMNEGRRLPFNPFWYRFDFQRPAHPSIDVGRESKADLDEMDRGITSEIALASERGKNAYKTIDQRIRFAKYVLERCEEEDVPVHMVINPQSTGKTSLEPSESAPGDDESTGDSGEGGFEGKPPRAPKNSK